MLFNSIQFIIYFILITILYFALPHRYRWGLLLAGSCYFYMAFVPIYILILFFTIVIDYYAGILLEDSSEKNKKYYMLASLVGNQKAERNFGIYALYVMFYPQLVAGPIERPQNILHQFYEKKYIDYDRIISGLRLMAWGFVKKIVVADRLAIIVDLVYNQPETHSGRSFLIAMICFAFQIFCDFSAYSDIALGTSRVMGFELMQNFNNPFVSKNITEFWRRWHISLSTWFND